MYRRYGAEGLGNILGTLSSKPESRDDAPSTSRPQSRADLIASIKADYDKNYFVSGKGDMSGYALDCVFADPFAAFRGVDRFKRNVGNLGALMREVRLDLYSFEERGNEVHTKWRFSSVLTWPPWRPRLAAAGSTVHVIDPARNLVVRHEENWDVEPSRVLQQLLLPSSKIPTSFWETLMFAASDGDAKGVWLALSPKARRSRCASSHAVGAGLTGGHLPT